METQNRFQEIQNPKSISKHVLGLIKKSKIDGLRLLVMADENPKSISRNPKSKIDFSAVDSLLALSSNAVAAGATDFSGLQIIDLEMGYVRQTVNWENMTKSGSTVQAIGTSPELLFTSFESSRRNPNSIFVCDLNDSFKVVSEIGHNEIFGADLDSAIPSTIGTSTAVQDKPPAGGSNGGGRRWPALPCRGITLELHT